MITENPIPNSYWTELDIVIIVVEEFFATKIVVIDFASVRDGT